MRVFLKALFPHWICSALLLFLAGCATEVRVKNTTHTFRTVVIDAGHGGKDSGAAKRGVLEKNAALDVALRLDCKLRDAGFNTVLTRKGDYFVELNERAAISNRQTNAIFISIHFNDSPRRRINGVETYYNSEISAPIASRICASLAALTPNRGMHHANFRVLKRNAFPAILVECGFLSNGCEANHAKSAVYRQKLADQIAKAIVSARGSL
jgi:N-acetylmuramoyl-L-alanine amidase